MQLEEASVLNYSRNIKAPTCLELIKVSSVRLLLSCSRDGHRDEKTQCYKGTDR